MKITIYGAGAIGGPAGHLGALLSRDGVDVSLIARGRRHLAAIQKDGLTLQQDGEEPFTVRPRRADATEKPSTLGPQDYVVVVSVVKSHQAPGAVEAMQPLLGPDTTVVTAMNGVPWWYFSMKLVGPYENHRVHSVDPDGTQWDGIGPERVVGCITYVAAEVVAPGVVKSGGSGRSIFHRGARWRAVRQVSAVRRGGEPNQYCGAGAR